MKFLKEHQQTEGLRSHSVPCDYEWKWSDVSSFCTCRFVNILTCWPGINCSIYTNDHQEMYNHFISKQGWTKYWISLDSFEKSRCCYSPATFYTGMMNNETTGKNDVKSSEKNTLSFLLILLLRLTSLFIFCSLRSFPLAVCYFTTKEAPLLFLYWKAFFKLTS